MKMLFYLLLAIIVLIVYVRYIESVSLFHPVRDIDSMPADFGLPFEDVFLTTQDDIKIHGWYIKKDDNVPTLLFFHGNAGNIGGRLGKILHFYDMGVNVFIIDYRGFGKSEGKPTEKGIYQDAIVAYDYLKNRKDVDPKKIFVYGASLGGVVAVDLALQRPLAALIIDSSFSSAKDMAKFYYPFIPSFLVSIKMDSERKIKDISVPKLIIHSAHDETVPFALGEKLYRAAKEPKEFLMTSGSHINGHTDDEINFLRGIHNFLQKVKLI
ncbi:MAG: alpha/beta hydrolase [Candidatus Omnitrophica bacterium]|nr:alpha/beta hydrolase [Candidatus Omnitrophota bacterium]MCB9747631.1 alpha/beta hydrolase [Candidatus Omnitrophota bacterium]